MLQIINKPLYNPSPTANPKTTPFKHSIPTQNLPLLSTFSPLPPLPPTPKPSLLLPSKCSLLLTSKYSLLLAPWPPHSPTLKTPLLIWKSSPWPTTKLLALSPPEVSPPPMPKSPVFSTPNKSLQWAPKLLLWEWPCLISGWRSLVGLIVVHLVKSHSSSASEGWWLTLRWGKHRMERRGCRNIVCCKNMGVSESGLGVNQPRWCQFSYWPYCTQLSPLVAIVSSLEISLMFSATPLMINFLKITASQPCLYCVSQNLGFCLSHTV